MTLRPRSSSTSKSAAVRPTAASDPTGRSTPTTRYADIVPDLRIVYSYETYQDGRRVSMSIGTVELESEGGATRLIYTEQGAFLDGLDSPADREHGTRELLDALGGVLQRAPTTAGAATSGSSRRR